MNDTRIEEIASLAESYALGEVLCDWSSALSYTTIINRLDYAILHAQSVADHFTDDELVLTVSTEWNGGEDPFVLKDMLESYKSTLVSFAQQLHAQEVL